MGGKDGFLGSAYDLDGVEAMGEHYDRWARSYEAELLENGYVTPRRCAEALAGLVAERDAPVLDLGCGTGLSGQALAAVGFVTLDGVDYSEGMLALAATKPGIYRTLVRADLSGPLAVTPGEYAHAVAAGVINPGHAPASAIDAVLRVLPPGGCLVLSLNDHALAEPEYPGAIAAAVAGDLAELQFEAYGDHIPGIGLKARVYGLRRRVAPER